MFVGLIVVLRGSLRTLYTVVPSDAPLALSLRCNVMIDVSDLWT